MEAIMRLFALFLMFLLILAACDSQDGQLPDPKLESSRLDPSTDFTGLIDLDQSLPSPSGRYVLSAYSFRSGDRASAIILRLTNSQGKHLDAFVTDVSSRHRWALGWHEAKAVGGTADTVVLQANTGTTVFNITSNGTIQLMECPQPEYGEIGVHLLQAKYPDFEQEAAEQGDAPERPIKAQSNG
jgi:hypothetical protein